MPKRRTRYEIYADLLDIVARSGSCRVTRASYAANLPVDRAKKSLTFLASRGFLKAESIGDSKVYRVAPRGLEYLDTFRKMRKLFAALDEKISPPQAKPSEYDLKTVSPPRVEAKLILSEKGVTIGDKIDLGIHLANSGEDTAWLVGIEEAFPSGFEVLSKPKDISIMDTYIDLNRKKLNSLMTEEIDLTIRSTDPGTYTIKPRIFYTDKTGDQKLYEPVAIALRVSEFSNRIRTGYGDLDALLLGGIPSNYSTIITSTSCDERDLLIRRFLETGLKNNQTTFYVTNELSGIMDLVENYQTCFYAFLCNPQADKIIGDAPNVYKLKGVENLTAINISLTSAFRKLSKSKKEKRRACIGIVSDVLLQHHAIQTRRWFTGLIPEFRAKGFTTLSVLNPAMHTKEEVQAILDLFEGEMNIYEKADEVGIRRYLRIKKMYNQRYLENQMPLIKEKLQG